MKIITKKIHVTFHIKETLQLNNDLITKIISLGEMFSVVIFLLRDKNKKRLFLRIITALKHSLKINET